MDTPQAPRNGTGRPRISRTMSGCIVLEMVGADPGHEMSKSVRDKIRLFLMMRENWEHDAQARKLASQF